MSITRVFCALLALAPVAALAQDVVPAGARAETTCSSDADDVRRAAIEGLMQADPSQTLPVIEKLLDRRDDCSVSIRRLVVDLLGRSRDPGRVDVMLRAARTDPSTSVRLRAVQAIAQVNSERSAAILDSIFDSSGDADIADMALRGLAQQSSPSARVALRRATEKTTLPIEVRMRAVNYIASSRRTSEDVQYLKDLYGKTSSVQLRGAVLRSVSYQRTPETTNWLLGIARDKAQEIELRQAALRSASQYSGGNPVAVEIKDVIALYDEFARQPDMQAQLVDVLGQRPESAATDKLMQIASDGEITLRSRAVQRLGQRRDPRVRQFLLDIVSR